MRLVPTWMLCLFGLLASACTVDRIDDLKVVGLRALSSSATDVPHDVRVLLSSESRLIEVTLATKSDLGSLAKRHELNIGVEIRLCGNEEGELRSSTTVFDSNRREVTARVSDKNSAGTYFVYFVDRAAARNSIHPDKGVIPSYDLMQQPADVCLHVQGGSMAMRKLTARPVRIDGELVRDAIVNSET